MLKSPRRTVAVALCAAAFVSQTVSAADPPTFAPPQAYSTATPAVNMVMGDFDGDGFPDVAVIGLQTDTHGNLIGGSVEVHFGDGANGFRSAPSTIALNIPGSTYSGIAAADLTGSGQSQLIIAASNTVVIYNWSGADFSLTRVIDLTATGVNANLLAVGDLTGPGSRDILVTDRYSPLTGTIGVVWIPNDGKGNFGTPRVFPTWGSYSRPVLADVNGDGLLDVVLDSPNSSQGGIGTNITAAGGTVGVLLNNGDGTLGSEVFWGNQTLYSMTNSSLNTVGVAVADVDGDGRSDLISACFTHSGPPTFAYNYYLSVNLGNPDGSFQDGKAFPVTNGIVALDAADLNGDGRVDIVTVDYKYLDNVDPGFMVTEFSGTGDSLAVASQEDFPADGPAYVSLALGYKSTNDTFITFNNDAKIDVLLGTGQNIYAAGNSVHHQFLVFKNTTVPMLPPTSVQITGTIAPGGPIQFSATQSSTVSGLVVSIQYSTTPTNEGSWTPLPDGNGGRLQLNGGNYTFGTNGTTFYPAGAAVWFRAVSTAPGFAPSISTPILGPYSLEQGELTINVRLTSTSDPSGALQIAHIGDNLAYTFAWTNIGNAPARELIVETPVPTYIDAASNLILQFPSNSLTFNQYGSYISQSSPGAGDAKVAWNVSDLAPGFSQTVTLTVHLGPSVRLQQMIGLPNNYRVYSTVDEPPVQATGYSSGAPNVGTTVLGLLQLTITPDVTNVAPGGLINYTINVTNLGAYTATNVVISDPAPEFTSFVPYNSATKIGTAFLNAKGAAIASPPFKVKVGNKSVAVNNPLRLVGLYPSNSLPPAVQEFLGANPQIVAPSDFADQAVFYVGNLAKGAGARVRFTVQAQYVVPLDVPDQEIKNFDYLAYFTDPSGNIVESKNESGGIFTPIQGAVLNAPNLQLFKGVSSRNLGLGDNFFVELVAFNGGHTAADDVFIQDSLPQGAATVNPTLLSGPNIVTSGSSQQELNAAVTLTNFAKADASLAQSKANYFVTLDPGGTITVHGLHLEPNAWLSISYAMSVPPTVPATTPLPESLVAGASFIGAGNGNQTPVRIGTNVVGVTVPGGTPQVIPMQVNGYLQLFTPDHPFEAVPSPGVSADADATAAQLDALYKNNINASLIVENSNPPTNIPGVQRYFFHYQNLGSNTANNVHLRFSMPDNTAFYRASFTSSGKLIKPGPGRSIDEPLRLGSGDLTFNLGNLNPGSGPSAKAGSGGYALAEVILLPGAVNTNSSRIAASTPQIWAGTNAPARALALMRDDATPASGGTIVYDGMNVPKVGVLKVVPQVVRQGDTFPLQLALFNYGDINLSGSAEIQMQAPAGAEIVGFDSPDQSIESVVSSNATSLDVTFSFASHWAAGLTVTLQATGAAPSFISEDSVIATFPYAGAFKPNPTSIQVVSTNTDVPDSTITTVDGAQFVVLGEIAVVPLGHDNNGNYALVSGPSDLFGDVDMTFASDLAGPGNGTRILVGRASAIPLLNLPVLANVDAQTALAELALVVGKHGGDIFNGPQCNIIAADGEGLIDNVTGSASSTNTVKTLVAGGGQIVVASGAGSLRGPGNSGPAVLGGGVLAVPGGGHVLTSGGGVISNDGGSVVSNDGGSLISQDGSGIIGVDSSGLISQDGSGLISQDGSGLISSPASAATARTAGGNIVASGAGNIVASGAGNIVSAGAGN